jgi:predicted GIY-YIG superfamily endonuclease
MSFWAYILHCNGGFFYAGHTDDLDRRMAEHESGLVAGFVADHWPAKLVWSEAFQTRLEAMEAERRIKGWSRAKKLVLISGDWNRISALAKSKEKDSPSTGSGQADREKEWFNQQPFALNLSKGRLVLPSFNSLSCHRDTPHLGISNIAVELRQTSSRLMCRYIIEGSVSDLMWTDAAPSRAGELWQHTCCELFLKGPGDGYLEYNLAPSGQWAAYRFDRYREGMRDADVPPPVISVAREEGRLILAAEIDIAEPITALALSTVIETRDGAKSWWALAHPPGKPDFHHPDCFTLELPAAETS